MNRDRYFECLKCGQTVQGFEAALHLGEKCASGDVVLDDILGVDHVWEEVPGPDEKGI